MPKYFFKCTSCENRGHRYVSPKVSEQPCSECGSTMNRELPVITDTEVRETIDPYTNKKWSKDQPAILKDRRDKHFLEVELPRLVDKYSLETCLENKWLIYNDKGELVINKDWTSQA